MRNMDDYFKKESSTRAEENKIDNSKIICSGDTFKIHISFCIDVPATNYESNINTLILDLYKFVQNYKQGCKTEIILVQQNEILKEIQSIAEILKYKKGELSNDIYS